MSTSEILERLDAKGRRAAKELVERATHPTVVVKAQREPVPGLPLGLRLWLRLPPVQDVELKVLGHSLWEWQARWEMEKVLEHGGGFAELNRIRGRYSNWPGLWTGGRIVAGRPSDWPELWLVGVVRRVVQGGRALVVLGKRWWRKSEKWWRVGGGVRVKSWVKSWLG